MSFLDGKSVLITGATGSFGKRFIKTAPGARAVAQDFAYSSDANAQWMTREQLRGVLASEPIEL
jgi:FlaA1/EpsC-like NDP-sugar epimerase